MLGWLKTCLGCKSICKLNVIDVIWRLEVKRGRDVNRSSRPWFILQATQICLNLLGIHSQLGLMRKCNVLNSRRVPSAEYHNFVRLVVKAF